MLQKEEILLIVYFVIVIFVLVTFVIGFFLAFQKRKNKFLLDRIKAEKKFEKELVNSQLEIQEQTLKNIAWELHDNIGQLLSVTNIQLNMLLHTTPEKNHSQITEAKEVVADTIQGVRSLSKILNTDVIQKNGLVESLKIELERFNKLKFLDASFNIDGEIVLIKNEHEILLFRILQEFLSNVMKHAKANKLSVDLNFTNEYLLIDAEDNGVGFNMLEKTDSSGMQTMKGRADLLKAEFSISSKIGEGTKLTLKYPINND